MRTFNFFKKKKQSKKDPPDDEQQNEFIMMVTNNAERIVSAYDGVFGGKLDYSENSLETLEVILDNFSNHLDEVDDEMKNDLIAQAGSYIFEVARRNYGGKYYWYDKLNQPIFVTGQPNFEISILAFDKVKQRIENGNEDNIPFFFSGYSERVTKGVEGDKALIV